MVFGILDPVLSPAVRVSVLATPNTEFEPGANEVALTVTSNRFTVPLSEEVPLKVTVPAEAVRLPVTVRLPPMVLLTAVLYVPVTVRCVNDLVPEPLILLLV